MNAHYNNILIPIDSSLNTGKAVAKAMEYAKPWGTTIHLVHLIRSWNVFKHVGTSSCKAMLDENVEEYLSTLINLIHWKNRIEKSFPGTKVGIHIKKDFSLHPLIMQATRLEPASLIIIARNAKRSWFSMGTRISGRLLAQKTGCNILSIKSVIKGGVTEEIETFFKPLFQTRGRMENARFVRFDIRAFPDLRSAN